MDEKNANGEINANESVKQLSDSDAQSVESAAEAREFDVVTEKPAQSLSSSFLITTPQGKK